ncbi:hypothetical protein [Kurthia senegalensis]|uniref:hypothetical protein n=1 Tax=Kurthia senegalensis TaxID=1033740 RepID=UPI000288A294|nr:hypothetical protein [Kurthia senegalensis]
MTNTNVAEIAHQFEDFLQTKMQQFSLQLDTANETDDELVRRAAFLARHNYVKLQRFHSESNQLQLIVQDAGSPVVKIDIQQDTMSCTCQLDQPCRHELAAMFTLYQYVGSLSQWLEDLRNKKTMQLRLLNEERTPEAWLKIVQHICRQNLYNQTKLNPYLLESIYLDMQQQILRYTPLEREWSSMYQLFTQISLLSNTWRYMHTTTETSKSYYINFIQNEADKLNQLIKHASTKSRLFALDPFYESLQQVVNYFLLHQEGYFDERLNIYTLFWESMFQEKRAREVELTHLKEARHYADDVDLHAVFAMFHIMLEQREQVEAMLDTMTPDKLLVWTDLAQFANRNNYKEMLETIVQHMLPHTNVFINEKLPARYRSSYVMELNELLEKIHLSEDDYELFFRAAGMYGIQPYSHHLIKGERYMEWAALHQRFPSSLSYLELCGLKDVLELKPEALLPLYHTLALNEVNQKSRQHYKQAVRIWKKMKSASKKAMKNEFWNDYVTTLRRSYKRLRALQEEIEKGNLML